MTVVTKHAPATDLDGLFDEAPAAKVVKDVASEAAGAEVVYLDAAGAEVSEAVFDTLTKEEQDKLVLKGDEGAPKSGGSPGTPVVDNTSDSGAVQLDEGGVPAGFRKEERIVKEYINGNIVEKFAEFLINEENGEAIFVKFIEALSAAPQGDKASDYTPAENKLFEAMGVMVKSVTDLKEAIEKQNIRIDAVEKTATTAQETAEETVVLSAAADDLGNAIQTLSGQRAIRKEAARAANAEVVDIFKGLLPGIEGNAA